MIDLDFQRNEENHVTLSLWEDDHWETSWWDKMRQSRTHAKQGRTWPEMSQWGQLWEGHLSSERELKRFSILAPAQVSPKSSMGIKESCGQGNLGYPTLYFLLRSYNAHIWEVLQYRRMPSPEFPRHLDLKPFLGKPITSIGLPRWLSGKESTSHCKDTGDPGSIPGAGRSPGEGNGNLLQ